MTIAEDVVMIAQIRHRNDGVGRTTMQIFHIKPRHIQDKPSDGGCGPLLGGLVLIVLLYIIAQAVQYFNQGPTP